jgi:hypothetical protein
MKIKYLAMRYGPEMTPVVGFNVFFVIICIGAALRNDLYFILSYLPVYAVSFLILNIVNAKIMYSKIFNKIGFDGNVIYATTKISGQFFSLAKIQSKISLDEIGTVDLRSDVNPPRKYKSDLNLSVIVLYGYGRNGDNSIVLDPQWANRGQFQDLIATIYTRRPEIFTENAKRYVEDGYADPPRIDEYGELVW